MSTRTVYQRLVRADRSEQPEQQQRATARNGLLQVVANALQTSGDQVVSAKTVLPWLLASVGAPAVLVGLLVPVRESGSMLPQAALAPWVQGRRRRRSVWVAGALGQAVATAAMAGAGATLEGTAAGVVIVLALAVFALSRSLCSLAGKDVLGRTVPKGERGQINGITTVLSGVVAVTLGLGIRLLGGEEVSAPFLAVLLGVAALAWVAAAAVFTGVREPVEDDAPAPEAEGPGWVRASWDTLREDATFRRFVLARALLLVTALSPPFVVAIAADAGGTALGALGPFVIAQGIAALIGGRWFGRWADRSSRTLMVWGGASASVLIVLLLGVLRVEGAKEWSWLFPLAYLLLALTHIAARVARKTYVVDLAEGDQRTRYIAVANTTMGVLLLVTGVVSGALATLGHEVALAFLAAVGFVGVAVSRSLPDVSSPAERP